jgi:hypothetical protein
MGKMMPSTILGMKFPFQPKNRADLFAMSFTVIGIHVIMLFELFVLLPWTMETYDIGRTKATVHIVCGFFLYFNVIFNYYKLLATDTTSGSVVLPHILKPCSEE